MCQLKYFLLKESKKKKKKYAKHQKILSANTDTCYHLKYHMKCELTPILNTQIYIEVA